MLDRVELVIYHGGTFISVPECIYRGGAVNSITIDPDLISYTHLLMFLKEGSYGNIEALYFKKATGPPRQTEMTEDVEGSLAVVVQVQPGGSLLLRHPKMHIQRAG
ncbi:unnamed protein product [Cuscuta epithymum]|uniref:PB1-like domain-containing protein n=1 Tax=Cuscuta epithymum TaxID=186058 RepID=A0AAV0FWH1_9ASTE|nr:unnamed protein product [Cuscuta epithymum]